MKKVLLSSLALAAGLTAFSQGKSSKAAWDDFASTTEYQTFDGSGVFFWGGTQTDANSGETTINTVTRSTGALDVTITQPRPNYIPFGVAWGDSNGDGTGTPFLLDLSGANDTLEIEVENLNNYTIYVRLALQDVDEDLINKYPGGTPTTAGGDIEFTIPANTTQTLKVENFSEGWYSDYSTGSEVLSQTFKYDQVKGVNITVIDQNQWNNALGDGNIDGAKIKIHSFKLGNLETIAEENDLCGTLTEATGNAGKDGVSFYDDFRTTEQYYYAADNQLTWWEGTTSSLTRAGDSKLGVTVSQVEGGYEPFGASFGDSNGDGTGTAYTIDLSSNKQVSAMVKNTSSQDLLLKLGLKDGSDNEVNFHSQVATYPDAFYLLGYDFVLPAGETTNILCDFDGAVGFDEGTKTVINGFDFSAVAGLQLTVVAAEKNGDDPVAITDATIEIMDVKLGDISNIVTPVTQLDRSAKGTFEKKTEAGVGSDYVYDNLNTNGTTWTALSSNTKTATGGASFEVDQAEGAFAPSFQIAFSSIDLTGDADIEVKFNNPTATELKVRVELVDGSGNIANYYASYLDYNADAHNHEIAAVVAANGMTTYSTNLEGALDASFSAIDLTDIVGVQFTVLNATTTGAPDYDPLALSAQAIEVTSIKVGAVPQASTGFISFGSFSNDFKVYPNPSNSVVTFSSVLTNAVVYNAQGVVVAEFATVESMNVANLDEGVYFVKAAEGSAKFMVK